MIDKATVANAIKAAPQAADDALFATQFGDSKPLTMAAFAGAARFLNRDVADVAADEIERLGLLQAFAQALRARGVDVLAENTGLTDQNVRVDELQKFVPRGSAFRCRVLVDHGFSGSGCLVSPSLVLTAWHVISDWRPSAPNPQYKATEVLLSDGTKRRALPKPVYQSPCTEDEYDGVLPSDGTAFRDHNDVVLLKLERPDGMRLGFAGLPKECPPPLSRSSILLLHFPEGRDVGFGWGHINKLRGNPYRWKHDVGADQGSSGGPCFNTHFTLIGLHQGKWPPDRRLVPTNIFIDDRLRELIEHDIAPPALWSLDGTAHGQLVVGRDLFFEAIAAASRPDSRIRGVRVKRRDIAQGTSGLAFSLEMLTLTLARNPGTHRTVRINFDTQFADLLDDIRRRTVLVGIDVGTVEAGAGARAGDTTLEASINDRARSLAAQANAIAERDRQLIWFLFDNPTAGLTDADRFSFEAFIAAVLHQPRLRLVLTGFETITTPGEEFANAGLAETEGAPGLVVEYFGVFNRGDVEQLLTRACRDFGVSSDPAVIADRTNQIVQGLNSINGQYSTADLKTVSDRAAPHLDYLKSLAGGNS
ncbi:MAG TPA: serine protease [Tardiphaga sp.]